MNKTRLEAFSDGVIAIIITIMVLELKIPEGGDLSVLKPLIPIFLAYVLSFQVAGIYWNNHHQLFQSVKTINRKIMWANLHYLFWLSLIPFSTGWLGQNFNHTWPTAIYGLLLLFCAFAHQILLKTIIDSHEQKQQLLKNIGNDTKGTMSLAIYIVAIVLSFFYPLISLLLYELVAAIWFIPDKRLVIRTERE